MMEKYEIQKLRELPIEKVAKEMGMKVEHHKALCPFHDDHHASLTFNKTKNSCRCYVCMRSSIGTIFIQGMGGLYCLIAISGFMSLMFPTIYGIALEGVQTEDTSLGAAFLVMAIVGGAVIPPLQGMVIDLGIVCGLPAVNASFALPLFCFAIVSWYGRKAYKELR